MGDVIRFAFRSHFGLHLGKRKAQCLREGPEMLLGLLIFLFFFFFNLSEDYISVFTQIIHLVVYL